MKKYLFVIFLMFFTVNAYSISSFKANYDLYGQTDLGKIKFGVAEYELIAAKNAYVFSLQAKTDKLWSALYNYTVNEISIGVIDKENLYSDYYKIIESQGKELSDSYEINIHPFERYALLNNELISNNFTKSELNKLSDSHLILLAIDLKIYNKIKFKDSQANDNDMPSYKKDLANREELIEALLVPIKNDNFAEMVDPLSLYLHISKDIKKYPNKVLFNYQIVDKNGVNQRKFYIDGIENMNINNNNLKTIKISCPELRLTFNIAEKYDYMPIFINKTNGQSNFQLVLTTYN